jgi:hypothetical protein
MRRQSYQAAAIDFLVSLQQANKGAVLHRRCTHAQQQQLTMIHTQYVSQNDRLSTLAQPLHTAAATKPAVLQSAKS